MSTDAPPRPLQPWQVITGGVCALVLTLGLGRFAYTPLLPQMHQQAGLSDTAGGWLAAINYAGYMGHCALRTYVMGQRAFTDAASEDDLARMVHLVKEAMAAGAHGFSTTRSVNHQTSDDKPVASRLATWHEFETLVKAMGAGMVEVAGEPTGAQGEKAKAYYEGLSKLAIESGRPITSPDEISSRMRRSSSLAARSVISGTSWPI